MRSLGDSRSPLIFLGISSILNIVLDLALVRPMGVAGTAWATIIAQGVSGFLCLFYMKKKIHHPCFYERGLEAAQALCA